MKNSIGWRLREYRIQSHMTQETVAKAMGISPQAVSKWENGTTLPDIALLVPLAVLFHVTTDEILGNNDRRDYWERNWQAVSANSAQEALVLSEKALAEMPNDKLFLYRRACSEYFSATDSVKPSERERLLEDSIRHFSELNTAYPDYEVAVSMLVRALSAAGRNEEAKRYAKRSADHDRLLMSSLTGAELSAQRRVLINKSAQNLIADLLRDESLEALQAAEAVTSGMILLFGDMAYSSFRIAVSCHKSLRFIDSGMYSNAVNELQNTFSFIIGLDDKQNQESGMLRENSFFSVADLLNQLKSCLLNDKYNTLHGRDDYSVLLNGIEEYMRHAHNP